MKNELTKIKAALDLLQYQVDAGNDDEVKIFEDAIFGYEKRESLWGGSLDTLIRERQRDHFWAAVCRLDSKADHLVVDEDVWNDIYRRAAEWVGITPEQREVFLREWKER